MGTGTGVWLFEASKVLPSTCSFRGYDISSDQFPQRQTWPENASLKVHSILEPFPGEEQGTYDVVAVRLLVTALADPEWSVAIQNLVALLKPGGYLQWIDLDLSPNSASFVQTFPGSSRSALLEANEAWVAFSQSTQRNGGGCRKLAGLLKEQGLVAVNEDVFMSDRVPNLRERFSKLCLGPMKAIMFRVVEMGLPGWTKGRAEKLVDAIEEETDSAKAYLAAKLVCVIGMKPLPGHSI